MDILVNNAGAMLLSTVGKGLSDEWRRMFDVNVLGLLYTTDAVEAMKRQGSGHLVNISSVAGRKVTRDSRGIYAGSKHAVGAISEGLRHERLEDNIRVTIVEPGAVETELADHPSRTRTPGRASAGHRTWRSCRPKTWPTPSPTP